MFGLYRIPWADRPPRVDLAVNLVGRDCGRSRLFDEVDLDCREERAFLFGNDEVFTILRPRVVDGAKIVEVVVAFAEEPVDALATYIDTIRQLAREIGATQLEFWTARRGFERLAPRLGWEKAFTVWRQPL